MALPPLQATPWVASDGTHRLRLRHDPPPGQPCRAKLLYVHPFAEEMNKSRRMAALAARALAAAGCTVVQIDLAGCGDSGGEFEQASWGRWVDDVREAAIELAATDTATDVPLWLWGLRAGALLCAEVAAQLPHPPNLLLWQPMLQGKAQLQQFMRLKAAAEIASGQSKAVLDGIKAELNAGRVVDIAGYRLPAAIASGLEQSILHATPLRDAASRLVWLEITARDGAAECSPAAAAALPRWQQAGWSVQHQAVSGPAFWQTVEMEEAPNLVQSTLDLVFGAGP